MCYCFIPLYVLVALGGAGAHPTEEKDEQLQREQLEVEFTQNILQNEAQYLRKTLKEDAEYLRQVKEEFPLESLNEALAAVERQTTRDAQHLQTSAEEDIELLDLFVTAMQITSDETPATDETMRVDPIPLKRSGSDAAIVDEDQLMEEYVDMGDTTE